MRQLLLCIAGLSLCVGCVRSSFLLTDSQFTPHRRPGQALVYLDRLPEQPYMSVGIIEVMAPATYDLTEYVSEAAHEGARQGCDFVMERSLHKPMAELPRFRIHLATYIPPPPPPTYVPSPPPGKREFICGIFKKDSAQETNKL